MTDRYGPRLLELSLRGFKSFSGHVALHFSPSMTAIIGPNGSGKSNLVDALLWLRGERSRQALRVLHSSEVLHHNAKGRVASAWVSLKVDTAGRLPYREVSFRRLIRSDGSQEVSVNGAKVRVRDLEELVDRLGILAFIVGQGEIDSILTLRPQELRERLEDGLGLGPIKGELARAREDLGAAQICLDRLRSMHTEIFPRFRTLDRLVRQGQEWRRLDLEIRRLSSHLYMTQLTKVRRELDSVEDKQMATEIKQEELAGEAEKLNRHLLDIDARLGAMQQGIAALDAEIRSIEARLSAARGRLQAIRAEIEEGENEAGRLKVQLEDLKADLARAEDGAEGIRRRRQALGEALEHLEARRDTLSRNLAELQNQYQALMQRGLDPLQELADQRDNLMARLEASQDKVARLSAEMESLDRLLPQMHAAVQEAELRLAQARDAEKRLRDALAQHTAQLAQLRTEVDNVKSARKDLELRRREIENALLKVRREVMRARDHERSLDGRPPVITRILDARDSGELEGIIAPVAELIEVPPEYSVAVWAALGNRRWDIVTETWDSAVRAIDMLRRQKFGRASFLPLDVLRAPASRGFPRVRGVVGLAHGLVRVPTKYKVAVEVLLGRTLIVEDLQVARQILADLRWGTVVTLTGDIVRQTGELSGGWYEAKDGRRVQENLRHLEERMLALEAGLADVDHSEAVLSHRISSTMERLQIVDEQVVRLSSELRHTERMQNEAQLEVDRWQQELQAKMARRREIVSQLERYRNECAELERVLNGIQEELAGLTETRRDAIAARAGLEEKLGRVKEEISAVEVERHRLLEEAMSLDRELSSREVRMAELRTSILFVEESLRGTQNRLASRFHEITKLEGEVAALELRRQQMEDQRRDSLHGVTQLSQERADVAYRHQEIVTQLESLAADARHLAQRADDLRDELAEIEMRAREELGFAWRELARGEVPSDLEGVLAETREKQRKLVLPDEALEKEHSEVRQRLMELEAQIEDLSSAVNSLTKRITELEAQMGDRWHGGLSTLSSAFADTFAELFGGGRAELQLDAHDGVQLVVQPPGKPVRSVRSLSGGERALTAVSLLLAMATMGGVPVCVFDEIDAALDDARAARLASMLTALSRDIQFVVITHNRHTMRACDTVYGLTLDASGATKAYSVRLGSDDGCG